MNRRARHAPSAPRAIFGLPLLLCTILFCSLPAARPADTIPYVSRLWQTDSGLPRNSVYAIAQSPDGYLWVGTQQGLARFDGIRFVRFEDASAPELRDGWITALWIEDDGTLWVGCDGAGVFRIRAGSITRFAESNGLANNQVRALCRSSDGTIWVGTENGLSRLQQGKFVSYTDKHGLGDNSIRAIIEDWEGQLRIATKGGLSSLAKGGVITNLNIATTAAGNATRCVLRDRSGALWVGSNEGLICYHKDGRLAWRDDLPDRVVNALYEDRQGQMWVGTYGGVARIVEGKVVSGMTPEAGINDLVLTLTEDQEGNLWAGGRDGLYRLTPRRFTTLTTEQGLIRNNVMSVLQDASGAVWIGTWGGGVSVFKDGTITNYTMADGLSHEVVLSLHEARDHSLWIGMDFQGGLNQLDPERRRFSRISPGIEAAVRVIVEDREGGLWVGTSKGLSVIRKGQTNLFNSKSGLPGDMVMALLQTRDGAIWVGTDGGLACWNKGNWDPQCSDRFPSSAINALYEDAGGTLWVGTKSSGLLRAQAGKFTTYGTGQGLFSNEIYEILEDDFGGFWFSCREGIFKVTREHLDQFDQGKRQTIPCTVFGRADGLLTVQCNGVAKPSGWKTASGNLWFPTIRGAVAVQSRIKTNERQPTVVIEEIRAGGRVLKKSFFDQRETVAVPAGLRELEIHYTALSLQLPEKNLFRYQLGDEIPWTEPTHERVARYYSLSHGQYVFRVKACNNDGVWNETGAQLALIIEPYFWETWWFRSAMGLGIGLVLFAIYRIRMARLREIETLRIQIAANLHDDVGARLTKVAMVTEFLDQQTPPENRVKTHVQTIAQTTREITQAMDEIVWTINPRNDTLDHLANYIFQYAQDYFQNTGVRCRLSLPAQIPDLPVLTEARHNIFMIVKEALNNILKHARATEARIGLSLEAELLVITISDDGLGFETGKANPSGNGLGNMQERATKIGGRVSVVSAPREGTHVRIEAPVS